MPSSCKMGASPQAERVQGFRKLPLGGWHMCLRSDLLWVSTLRGNVEIHTYAIEVLIGWSFKKSVLFRSVECGSIKSDLE